MRIGAIFKIDDSQIFSSNPQQTRIYPSTPWSGPVGDHGLRPWSQSPSESRKTLCKKGFLSVARLFWDLVLQTQNRAQGEGLDP